MYYVEHGAFKYVGLDFFSVACLRYMLECFAVPNVGALYKYCGEAVDFL